MSWIMVDVESDGPAPGLWSMVSFGAVVVRPGLDETFYSGWMRPLSDRWEHKSLEVCCPHADVDAFRAELEQEGRDPAETMQAFAAWLKKASRHQPQFISDNNGFDWQWVNYYFWHFCDRNPFGWSSANQGSLYKGQVQDTRQNFKHLRRGRHDHHALSDALGNAHALLEMQRRGLGITLE